MPCQYLFRAYDRLLTRLGVLQQIIPHMWAQSPPIPKSANAGIPIQKPTWGLSQTATASEAPALKLAAFNADSAVTASATTSDCDQIKVTWLGHACFLVEMPARNLLQESKSDGPGANTDVPARGARILFDPVFSDRCSPVQFMGPKRFTGESRLHSSRSSLMRSFLPQNLHVRLRRFLR